jgi:starvation-inducible DNA-binding protein
VVYAGIVTAHRGAIETTGELDLVTQDMVIGQARQLEEFDWFVRAHLEAPDGSLTTGDARTEQAAARRAAKKR